MNAEILASVREIPELMKPNSDRDVKTENIAQAILELACHFGLEYLFLTGGTDLAPIQDGLVKLEVMHRNLKSINVPHEIVSTAMAIGYGMMRRKPAAVAVHVDVGTANAVGNITNAARSRIPLILIAGKTPITESGNQGSRDIWIHWGQDVYDQEGIVREFVKWHYEIKRLENLPDVIARAFKVTQTSPQGPVYLTFSREILMDTMTKTSLPDVTMSKPPIPPEASINQVKKVVRLLVEADYPAVITCCAGRNPDAMHDLMKVCNALGIALIESFNTFANYPTRDPMHLGFDSSDVVSKSDLLLILDCMVPWIPSKVSPRTGVEVIQVDEDPIFADLPMWSFPVDIQIQGEPALFLRRLREQIEQLELDQRNRERVELRRKKITEAHESWKRKAKERALRCSNNKPIDMTWLSYQMGKLVAGNDNDNTILVNEYRLEQDQVEITRPMSYFGSIASGYLGLGLGEALGLKLSSPSSLVIACLGDGAYIFSVPEAAHWVSNAYNLPFLTVIFNNQGWAAERAPIDRLYPKGWSTRYSKYIGVYLDPPGDYSKIVTAFGGYGEQVTEPSEVYPALRRAVAHIKTTNKQAVLDVICKKA